MNLEAWLALLEKRHPQTVDLGLERCGAVYGRLGFPRPAKQVFTVAGTNGKGSTVAYLAAIADGMGQRFGTYTSPHIFRFNERISVMGDPVSDECLVNAFEQVEAARDGVSLTYFEFTTLAGLLVLKQSDLDCAILEVGLGGRLDTVNLVDADCAVITPIGLDHLDYLGPDLDSIATEKAGIIRPGNPVVCTEAHPPAPILQVSERLQAPVYRRGIDYDLVDQASDEGGPLRFSLGDRYMPISRPSMAGKHQRDNLAAALCAYGVLNQGCFQSAGRISGAIRDIRVPGRLQTVYKSPDIVLDVGHNELAAEVVADFLEQRKSSATTCVLAMLADKSAEQVAIVLDRVCGRFLCADSPGDRGQTGTVLAQRIKSALPGTGVESFDSLDAALQDAVSSSVPDETILVFGSFLTVSAAAGWVHNSMRHDGHDAARIT